MLVPQAFENSLLNDVNLPPRPAVFGQGLPGPLTIGPLLRFTGAALTATAQLRDFKQAAFKLILNCMALSIISPLLADHVLREAVRAIEDLNRDKLILPSPCSE
ncbi:MAG: DUF2935 domain-containing protein [Bacillota bacterium]